MHVRHAVLVNLVLLALVVHLSAHTVPTHGVAKDSRQQVEIPNLRNLRFLVRGIDESVDNDGPLGRIFVKQQGGSKQKLTQEQLDAAIGCGHRPDLEFENNALATKFCELREQKTNIELHLDERGGPGDSLSGKRSAREVDLQGGDAMTDRDDVAGGEARLALDDKSYLTSYSSLSVHETMVKDRVRTEWFLREIEGNKELFKDAVVLDVGTGTGVLAMFAARAGARKVYAVECSEIAGLARKLVEDNGFNETISVLQGDVEKLDLPEKVDIIVSEWMGFYLLHESMLMSVISARNRFLKPNGLILPSAARLYAAPVRLDSVWEARVQFWEAREGTFGLDMRAASEQARRDLTLSPLIETVPAQALLAPGQLLWEAELLKVQEADALFLERRLEFALREGSVVHGICLWFDVRGCNASSSPLSTSPHCEPTHWKQTCVLLGQQVEAGSCSDGNATRRMGFEVTVAQASRRQFALALELFDPEKRTEEQT